MDLRKILKVVTDACNQFAFTLQILKFSKEHRPWKKSYSYNSENRKLSSALQMSVTWYDRTTIFQTLFLPLRFLNLTCQF